MERNSEIVQQYSNWSQGLENDAKEIKSHIKLKDSEEN